MALTRWKTGYYRLRVLRAWWPSTIFALALVPLLALSGGAGCKDSTSDDVGVIRPGAPLPLPERSRDPGVGLPGMVYSKEIPDDFPRTLPLYPGGRITLGGVRRVPPGKRSWSLTVETPDPKLRVLAFYQANLPGFEPTGGVDVGDSVLAVWRSPPMDLDLYVGKGADGNTTVTLDVEER
jgi:hypothetical protein